MGCKRVSVWSAAIAHRSPRIFARLRAQQRTRIHHDHFSVCEVVSACDDRFPLVCISRFPVLQQQRRWLTSSSDGDMVAFERWGAIHPTQFISECSLEVFAERMSWCWEARAMILDCLTRRSHRLARLIYICDLGGIGLGHRKLMKYLGVWVGGDEYRPVPDLWRCTYFVRSNRFGLSIFKTATHLLWSRQQVLPRVCTRCFAWGGCCAVRRLVCC